METPFMLSALVHIVLTTFVARSIFLTILLVKSATTANAPSEDMSISWGALNLACPPGPFVLPATPPSVDESPATAETIRVPVSDIFLTLLPSVTKMNVSSGEMAIPMGVWRVATLTLPSIFPAVSVPAILVTSRVLISIFRMA